MGLMHLFLDTLVPKTLADPFRKHSGGGNQKQVDDVAEFEDEEAFLNLDDILQGRHT